MLKRRAFAVMGAVAVLAGIAVTGVAQTHGKPGRVRAVSVSAAPARFTGTTETSLDDRTSTEKTASHTQVAIVPPTIPGSPPMSREKALDSNRRDTASARRIDRLEAKLTEWGLFHAVSRAGGDGDPAGFSVDQQVWVVAAAGEFVPQFGHGRTFPWAVRVYDVDSGNAITTLAGKDGEWPPFFDAIQDLAPGSS